MKKLSFLVIILVLSAVFTFNALTQGNKVIANHPVYDFNVKTIDGENISLDKYKGKVLLIVNVASKCGYTPQYAGLEELYKKYKDKGLVILGFPCNQFRGQEPGSNKEIKEFCSAEYGVTFPLFSKIEVNGEDADPLFHYLTKGGDDPIRWNFEKFLIDSRGLLVQRFRTKEEPKDIAPVIEKWIALIGTE